jgi:mannose-1-phosphate guanylyltransferase
MAALRGLVLCAGLGTRLRPLTDRVPKPLVQVCGRPVIEPLLEWFAAAGIREVCFNTHHLADRLRGHLGDGARWGVELTWRHEETLLAGAGTLKSFEDELGDATAVVANGDALHDVDLAAALATHRRLGSALTLVTAPLCGPPVSPVAWDDDGRLRGIRHFGLEDRRGVWRGEFSGVHLVEPEIWRRHIPRGRSCNLVSEVIPRLLERGVPVVCHLSDGLFCTIDDAEGLARAHRLVLHHRTPRYLAAAVEVRFGVYAQPRAVLAGDIEPPVFVGRDAVVAAGARLGPYAALGAGQRLAAGERLAFELR